MIEGETYYTFSDQHGSQWATEGPCDHDDDLPLERYCVDIEGDWTWVELPHAPSDYDPTGDECQPEPEELTWCVPDGDGGWTKQDHVDGHQPNDAVAPDSEGDCPEPNGRPNTIWVCDTDTEYAYEIDEVRFDTDIHWEAEDSEECEHPVRIPDEVENPYCVYDDEQEAWLPALLTNEQVEGLDDDDIDPTGGLCEQDDNPGGDATPITRVLDDTRVTSSGPETEVLSSETAAPAADELPRTGAEVPNLIVLALLLLTSGGWIIAIGRRTENT